MKQDIDFDKIVDGVVKCVVEMEQAYLDLLLELYGMGWITMSTLESRLVEHEIYCETRLATLGGKSCTTITS